MVAGCNTVVCLFVCLMSLLEYKRTFLQQTRAGDTGLGFCPICEPRALLLDPVAFIAFRIAGILITRVG